MQRLNSANVSHALLEKAQNRVIDAALTFIRERAKFKASPDIFLLLQFCLTRYLLIYEAHTLFELGVFQCRTCTRH